MSIVIGANPALALLAVRLSNSTDELPAMCALGSI